MVFRAQASIWFQQRNRRNATLLANYGSTGNFHQHLRPAEPDFTFLPLSSQMEELAREKDPFEALVNRLNADLVLDTQLMEALKIHVLSGALSLELASALGDALPRFALDLFLRPDSRNARELSINYLNCIGDSSTLQKVSVILPMSLTPSILDINT